MKKIIFISSTAFLFFITACVGIMADSVWSETKTVAVNGSKSNDCVVAALHSIPGVEINDRLSRPGDYVLNLSEPHTLQSVGVYVRRLSPSTVQVIFAGKGVREPEAERITITPLLTSITDAIKNHCSR